MKITFRQIDAFRTVVSTGTVTESAQLLGISQPAVSRLVSDLESEIGFKLFTRSGRHLKPTLEAHYLVDEVKWALSGLEKIKDAARAIQQFGHSRLHLITTPTFATVLGPRLVKMFSERRPEAMISMEVQPTDATVEWLVSQEHDFGVAQKTGRNPTIMSRPLVITNAVCILPPGHRLERKKSIKPDDLADESFISYLPDSLFRFEVDEIFRNAAVGRRMQYEARTTGAIYRLVSEGLGVSIVGSADGENSVTQRCTALPFSPRIPFDAALIWSRQKTLSTVAEDFLTMVEETFKTPQEPL